MPMPARTMSSAISGSASTPAVGELWRTGIQGKRPRRLEQQIVLRAA